MASNDSFLKFRADIRQLAAGISGRLPEHVNAMIRDELEYGLYDMATTDIAATLMREKVPVTREERDTLQRVLFCFRTPMEYYPFITHREDVLASLVVRDAPDRGTPLASIAAHLPGWSLLEPVGEDGFRRLAGILCDGGSQGDIAFDWLLVEWATAVVKIEQDQSPSAPQWDIEISGSSHGLYVRDDIESAIDRLDPDLRGPVGRWLDHYDHHYRSVTGEDPYAWVTPHYTDFNWWHYRVPNTRPVRECYDKEITAFEAWRATRDPEHDDLNTWFTWRTKKLAEDVPYYTPLEVVYRDHTPLETVYERIDHRWTVQDAAISKKSRILVSPDGYPAFRHDLQQLLEQVSDRLPEYWRARLRDLRFVGELTLSLNSLAALVMWYRIPVTPDERDLLDRTLAHFRLPTEYDRFINHREDVVSSLMVRDTPSTATPLSSIAVNLPDWHLLQPLGADGFQHLAGITCDTDGPEVIALDWLLVGWATTVLKIEQDQSSTALPWDIWDAAGFSEGFRFRDLIETTIEHLDPTVRAPVTEWLSSYDHRYRCITIDDQLAWLARQIRKPHRGQNWWYYRVPNNGPMRQRYDTELAAFEEWRRAREKEQTTTE